jgi:hypothetical protein
MSLILTLSPMRHFLLGLLSLSLLPLCAQTRYMTRNASISFFSDTFLEDIQAENKQVGAIIDFGSGELAFSLLNTQFVFPNSLMQEHFNENYIESEKYPKATFKGRFKEKIDPLKEGIHHLVAEGELSLHGVTRQVSIPATIEIKNGKLTASSKFNIATADYKIDIPALVRDKIAKEVAVTVLAPLMPVKP